MPPVTLLAPPRFALPSDDEPLHEQNSSVPNTQVHNWAYRMASEDPFGLVLKIGTAHCAESNVRLFVSCGKFFPNLAKMRKIVEPEAICVTGFWALSDVLLASEPGKQ